MASKRQMAKFLREVANRIETFGWIQGSFGDESKGFCVLGATSGMGAGAVTTTKAWKAVKLTNNFDLNRGIADWNDQPGQCQKDVLCGLRKAARALEHGLKV